MIKAILNKLSSQIRKPNVKLPTKPLRPEKIQDNNQSIEYGAINEKSNVGVRSPS
jgi:hypothetical protein